MNNHRQQGGEIPIFVRVLLILVACLVFGAIVVYTNNRDKQESSRLQQLDKEYKQEQTDMYSFTLSGEAATSEDDFLISVCDVLDDEYDGEIVVDSETFFERADNSTGYASSKARVSLDVSCSLAETDVAVLQFKAQTEEGSGWLRVCCGADDVSVWVSETSSSYYIPISGEYEISEIRFEMDTDEFVKTNIDEVYLVKYEDTPVTDLMVGVYSDYECESTVIEAENCELSMDATACLVNDGYLYALNNGTLEVYRILDTGYEIITSYGDIGTAVDMAFNKDKNAIVVTAGLNGAYIFDVSEPDNLTLVSHYATLEESNGIFVSENYAFVCDRFFGVEIVDISDISNPLYVSQVGASAEYYDCYVSDGYLYVGVYAEKRVDIYDISDINNPSLCSTVSLDGNGQGVFALDGILYVATGRDSGDTLNYSYDLSDYGKGTGNGLEIIDVSDPENPVHLSTSKTLGRLSYAANDIWDVVVSNGYAYLSSRYNGLYVFDVSDPENPVCVDIYQIEAKKGSEFFEYMNSSTYAFSYDTDSIARGCICHVLLQDGFLYAVAANMGIYKIEADYITEISQTDTFEYASGEENAYIPSVSDCEVELYEADTSIYAVAAYDGYYYVSCGDGGIDVLDDSLRKVAHYPMDDAVLDIKAASGYLYTAESQDGIGIWSVSGDTIERISSYCPDTNVCCSSLVVTDDGNYIIAQNAIKQYVIVDATDKYEPVSAGTSVAGIGSMYYRNVCSGVAENYLCVYGDGLQCWYYYDGSTFSFVNSVDNDLYSQYGGMCAVGDVAVYITGGGYCYFEPAGDTISDIIRADDVTLKGKCFSEGDILVVVDEYGGDVTVLNVEDIDNPDCIAQFTTEGNPDIGIIDGDYLLIPCRNYGLLRIDISALE